MPAVLGGWQTNIDYIEQAALQAVQEQVDVLVCPELAVIGYPPEDLLYRQDLSQLLQRALERLCSMAPALYLIVGHPVVVAEKADQTASDVELPVLANALSVFYRGQRILTYHKQQLPSYQVFDEKRYFKPGTAVSIARIADCRVACCICEDVWFDETVVRLKSAAESEGALDGLVVINASPFHRGKPAGRVERVSLVAKRLSCWVAYVNLVGGQDELVFDGGSFVVDSLGELIGCAPLFEPACLDVDVQVSAYAALQSTVWPASGLVQCYQALVIGVRDYMEKNGFAQALLGLSGGVDSALTLAIAVDALGSDRVTPVMLPFEYTSKESLLLAQEQANLLGVDLLHMPIHLPFQVLLSQIEAALEGGAAKEVTLQNLQARIRGTLLMALSNQTGAIVLTTGNKSELAMGYSTLYGDMAGGFNVLKDVYKTEVYQLALGRNEQSMVIPMGVIERAPSAELAPNQRDEDSLPPYEQLDTVLRAYIDDALSVAEISARLRLSEEWVAALVQRVDRNEYKRRQGAPGVRLSKRSFVRDRRYPMTFHWQSTLV